MLARKEDPLSSHIAADEIQTSGKLGRQKEIVYRALMNYLHPTPRTFRQEPTAAELAKFANLDRYMVSRRLPDLEKAGIVERLKEDGSHVLRKCRVTGRSATLWRVK